MHFAGLFRRATGYRPREFVLRRRIEAACDVLRSPRAGVLSIATQCGFRSHAHFAMVFERVMGATPSKWHVARAGIPGDFGDPYAGLA
jgi:transcriptional regulator GlxA family with amidase domain